MKPTEIILKYNGDDTKHITGLPAQDLTNSDVKAYGEIYGLTLEETISALINGGLYSAVKKEASKKKDNVETETVKE